MRLHVAQRAGGWPPQVAIGPCSLAYVSSVDGKVLRPGGERCGPQDPVRAAAFLLEMPNQRVRYETEETEAMRGVMRVLRRRRQFTRGAVHPPLHPPPAGRLPGIAGGGGVEGW